MHTLFEVSVISFLSFRVLFFFLDGVILFPFVFFPLVFFSLGAAINYIFLIVSPLPGRGKGYNTPFLYRQRSSENTINKVVNVSPRQKLGISLP